MQRKTVKRNPLMRGLSSAKNASRSKILDKQRGSVYALASTLSFDVKPSNISWTGYEHKKPKKKLKKGRVTAAVTPRREDVHPPPPSEQTCYPALSTHRDAFQDN